MSHTNVGHATSVDLVKQQHYSTGSLVGSKRTFEQLDPEPSRNTRVFTGITNIGSVRSDHCCLRLGTESNRIRASEICNVHAADLGLHHVSDFTQKQAAALTPPSSLNPLLFLSHPRYCLPQALVKNFASLGINSIYPWQSSCLLGRGFLSGEKNLVYTAPTGGGKSLVADVLMLKRVIEDPTKKAILVLPYVALVQEKLKWLTKAVEGVPKTADTSGSHLGDRRKSHKHGSVRVVGFYGGSKTRATWSDVDVAVCTIEKVSLSNDFLQKTESCQGADMSYRQIH